MKLLLIATIALICCMYTIQQAEAQHPHDKPLTGDHHSKPFAAAGGVKPPKQHLVDPVKGVGRSQGLQNEVDTLKPQGHIVFSEYTISTTNTYQLYPRLRAESFISSTDGAKMTGRRRKGRKL
uniref:Putative secreted protein n=1 Tax=Panstrongylus lignarius TaxID=156445 RepID=A0A224Y1M5_9HEMI